MELILKTLFVLFIVFALAACSGTAPSTIGQFAECPDKPNCVSSKSLVSTHAIDPLIYQGSPVDARKRLLMLIKSLPRTKVVTERDNFIHVEFTSKIFRFVDDVEFYFEEPGIIHFRSASRIGHSDLGVNRKRMEHIRQLFENNARES